MPARLLMAAADDLRPELDDALETQASAGARATPPQPTRWLADLTADADLLKRQRWAIIAPQGPEGDAALEALEPLRRLRSQEQEAEAMVLRVPPGMSASEAITWKAGPFTEAFGSGELERPRYLLLAGSPHGVSLPLERALSSDGIVGRLHFRDPDGYGLYVNKLLRPPPDARPQALFHVVEDGTPATALARDALVEPLARRATSQGDRFHGDVRRVPGQRSALLEAAQAGPAVMLSAGHGLGPPRRDRGWDPERLQGALSFGPGEAPLTGEDVARGRFLPHGVWLLFACYGAGTPHDSAYAPWLRGLVDRQLISPGVARAALRGAAEGPGFVAALPQALLANPEGPVAVIGHVDLAWSYSFEATLDERTGDRAGRFGEVIEDLLRRKRVGAALLELTRWSAEVNRALTARLAEAMGAGAPPPELMALWMMRQDLEGFTLLGDPAARLPSDFEDEDALFAKVGFGRRPEPKRGGFGGGFGGFGAPAGPSLEEKEAAVLAVLRGEGEPAAAARLGLPLEEVKAWVRAYCEAGRRALSGGR
ncbi:MAG: hypothetical protein H6740_25485 [Alphaproteobacteria bacterium]|nr:hypothetical protein [Alphaproteobacteria bacterium]